MNFTRRHGLVAVLVLAAAVGSEARAQTASTITRPDGTRIETTIFGPTSMRVTISGGPQYASPVTVEYTNITYGATEIVYEGTVTSAGVTEALTCRVNTATGAVTGTGACQTALGGETDTATPTTPTTPSTPTTPGDTGTVTVDIDPSTAAAQGRAWARSGALNSLLAGRSIGAAIEGLAAIESADLDPVFEAFQALATDAQRAAAARQLEPVAPSAAATNAVATAKAVANTVLGRTIAMRGGTGVSTGDLASGLGLWAQPFGYRARQDMRDGQDGYEDRTIGVAIGVDTAISETTRLGLALAYAATRINGRDASSGDRTDVKGGTASLYFQYEGRPVYLVGQVTGGINHYDGDRRISLTNQVAEADYRGWQLGARLDAGLPMEMGGGWQVTPMAGLAFVRSHVDGYAETGAGPLNLRVEDSRNKSLTGSLGGRLSYDRTTDGTTLTPYLQAVASYDVLGERPQVTASFAPGGGSFVTRGAEPARLGADLTLGVDVLTSGNLSLAAAYTYSLRDDFRAHGGSLRLRLQY